MADKKKKEERSFQVLLGGKPHTIKQGILSDEEFAKLAVDAADKGNFVGGRDDFEKARYGRVLEPGEVTVEERNASPTQGELKLQNGDTPEMQAKMKAANAGGPLTGRDAYPKGVEEVPLSPEMAAEKYLPSGGGTGTKAGIVNSIAAMLSKGATPKQNDVERALQGASADPVSTEKLLGDNKQKTSSTAQAMEGAPTRTSPAMSRGLGDAFKKASMLDSARADTAAAAQEVPTVPMQAPLGNRGPPEATFTPPDQGPGILDQAGALLKSPLQLAGVLPKDENFNSASAQARAMGYGGAPDTGGSLVDLPPVTPKGFAEGKVQNAKGELVTPAVPVSKGIVGAPGAQAPTSMQVPDAPDRRAAFDKSFQDTQAAQMKLAELDKSAQDSQIELQRKGQIDAMQLHQDNLAADAAANKHIQDAQSAYAKTIEEAQAPQKTDPNRWWNSRSTAQKIFAVLSAGLTKGATIPMFQAAVDADVDAQQKDITNMRDFRNAKAQGQHNVYQMAVQHGLNEHQARLAAEANLWDNVEKSSKLAAMTSKSQSVIANAQEQAAMANGKHIEALQKMDESIQKDAFEKKKLSLIESGQANQLRIAQMKAAGKGAKPGKGAELVKGTQEAAAALEKEMIDHPGSPKIGQLRASLMLHMNKLQGGRFNEEIHKMNEALIPGNEGSSMWQRFQALVDPKAVREKFKILVPHIQATADQPDLPGSSGSEEDAYNQLLGQE